MQDSSPQKSTRSKRPPPSWARARRRSVYKAPPKSRFRRILRLFFNGWTLSITLIVLLVSFLTLTYFWFEFSDRIDQKLLSGDVFTQSAGIYSAPKTLRIDEASSAEFLINYLKSAGYIERSDRADKARSRYWLENDILNIEPGNTGTIDGQNFFQGNNIKFGSLSYSLIKELWLNLISNWYDAYQLFLFRFSQVLYNSEFNNLSN